MGGSRKESVWGDVKYALLGSWWSARCLANCSEPLWEEREGTSGSGKYRVVAEKTIATSNQDDNDC